jgi:predicted ATP-dependent protease
MQQRVREATRDTLALAAGHLIDEVRAQFKGRLQVDQWLEEVRRDIVEAGERLRESGPRPDLAEGEAGGASGAGGSLTGRLQLQRYEVNLFVGNGRVDGEDLGRDALDIADGHATGTATGTATSPNTIGEPGHPAHAPVRTCEHPTYANLVGRIDHIAHMGTLLTNFTLIRAGALHRANGGVLLLDALKVLTEPMAWAGLKRALRSGHVVIESLPQALGWVNTLPLEPEPMPLDVKIVLVGERRHYYLLQALDPDFDDLFKVAADFEDDIERSEPASAALAHRLQAMATGHGLRRPTAEALARLVDHAARLAGDANRLSIHARPMTDLLREADALAAAAGRPHPGALERADIEAALAARIHRADRLRDRLHDALMRGTLHVATDGARTAQVNGLAVMDLGDFRFGHPVRITATTRLGDGHVVDIERESTLGGALHTKGVMILSSFLAARYAQGMPLSLAASLVFEQSYGPVEGDSASLAELCALLSALAGVPVRQDRAVTGSVDQHGRVQAVGGVNEKIEGFFDLCRARGLSGSQGVLIPRANVQHLMLRDDVVAAAEAGRFHVWPVDDVDTALSLLTDTPAGPPDSRGVMPEGSLNQRVTQRLLELSERRQRWAAGSARSANGRKDNRRPTHPGSRSRPA